MRELNAFERTMVRLWLRGRELDTLSEGQQAGVLGALDKLQVAKENAADQEISAEFNAQARHHLDLQDPAHDRAACRICVKEAERSEEKDRQTREVFAKQAAEWKTGLAGIAERKADLRRRVDESVVSKDWAWVAEFSEVDQLDVVSIIERRLEADAPELSEPVAPRTGVESEESAFFEESRRAKRRDSQ